jgi:hypothetical protein
VGETTNEDREIELLDEQAEALERAAADGGFASSSDMVLAAIGDLISTSDAYDPGALAHDVAEHQAAKRRGEPALTPGEARTWLRKARSA